MTARGPLLRLAPALLAACGYGFTAGAGRLPAGAEKVWVAPLKNQTADADAGALVAAALRQELARRGALGGPGDPGRIEGTVEAVTTAPSSPASATYRLSLRVWARLGAGGRMLAEQRVQRDEDYLGGIDPLESEGRRQIALRRAAEAAARQILERFEAP